MEVLWQVLRMCDVGGKLLNGIKSMYFDSSARVRIKGDESERFRIDSGVNGIYILRLQFKSKGWQLER